MKYSYNTQKQKLNIAEEKRLLKLKKNSKVLLDFEIL